MILDDIGPVSWINDDMDLLAMLGTFPTAESIVFDLETTGLNEHATTNGEANGGVAARVSLATFTIPQKSDDFTDEWNGVEPTTWILPLSHPDSPFLGSWKKQLKRVAKAILKDEQFVVGHNVKFDCRWVYSMTGVDLSDRIIWDTRISSHLLDENSPTSLKKRAPETFGVEAWDEHDLSYPGASEDVPLVELGEYGAGDTYWTWRLYQEHLEQLALAGEEADLSPVDDEDIQMRRLGKLALWVAMPTVAGLTKVEQRGILLDTDWVEKRLASEVEIERLALDYIAESYDRDRSQATVAATSNWFRELTAEAVERGELQVASMTKNGRPQWSQAVLEKQARNGSELAQQILNARTSSKRAQYLRSWLASKSPTDTIHSTYNAGVVVTGRLSSSDPNMQQVTQQLRPAFIPRPGYVLADIDYSQIELRVAAHVSQCQPMIEAFRRGDDLHRLLGAKIAHKNPEDVTPEERQKAKSANFGLLYGMGAYGFQLYAETAYGVDMSIEEASHVHATFFEQWEGMREWHIRSARIVGQRGEVVSPIGRVRRLPQAITGDEYEVSQAERGAVNSPVQGFASDLMQMATASIEGVLPGQERVDGAHVVATVHDSIVVELAEDRWETALDECIDRMTEGLTGPLKALGTELTVPLKAEAVVGTRWGLEDIKTE